MYGSESEFKALLSHLKAQGDTKDVVHYNYPYAFTESQAKETLPWFKVGKNQFRICNFNE